MFITTLTLLTLLALVLALIALITVSSLSDQVRNLAREVRGLRAELESRKASDLPSVSSPALGTPHGRAVQGEASQPSSTEKLETDREERPVSSATIADAEMAAASTGASPSAPVPSTGATATPSVAASPPNRSGWEENLGTRLPVWLGATAMALAVAFLVQYSFQHDLIDERMRVAIGLVAGATMIGLGERLRLRSASVAQGLTAAGVAALFTAILAGVRLYELIHPTLGFFVLAGVTALAVLLSLRQGPLVAFLGLLGGFLTPALIGSEAAEPSGLFSYLLLLQAGLVHVIRREGWWSLGLLTLLGGMAWAGLWSLLFYSPAQSAWVGGFLLVSVFLFVTSAPPRPLAARVVGWAALALGYTLACILIGVGGFSGVDWVFLGLLTSGTFLLARLRPSYEPMAWLASAIVLTMLLAWYPTEGELTRFITTAALLVTLLAGGAYASLWGSMRPDRWATLSLLTGNLGFLVTLAGLPEADLLGGRPAVAVLLGVLYAGGAALVYPRRDRSRPWLRSLAALVLAVVVATSLAVALQFERQWLTVFWAVELPLLALAFRKLRLKVILAATWVIGALVLLRAANVPMLIHYPTSDHPLWSWLLYGYPVPILCFTAAAISFSQSSEGRRLSHSLGGGAIFLAVVAVTLMTRQAFHSGRWAVSELYFDELALGLLLLFTLGHGLLEIHRHRPLPLLLAGGMGVLGLAVLATLVGVVLAFNPLWVSPRLHTLPLWAGIIACFLAPAAATGYAAWRANRLGIGGLIWPLSVTALIFGIMGVTLLIRVAFHGADVTLARFTLNEWGVISIAWTSIGLLLVYSAIHRPAPFLKGCAAVWVLLAGAQLLLAQGFFDSPLFHPHPVAGPVLFNALLLTYALPMALLAWAGKLVYDHLDPWVGQVVGGMTLSVLFLFVTLQIRQAFHGPVLVIGEFMQAEWYAYSVAWIFLAGALLAAGLLTGGRILRWASLVVMLLAVGKVFLFDTSHLQDLYRVLSLLGLGVSLLALAHIYQRFVFAQRKDGSRNGEEPGGSQEEQG